MILRRNNNSWAIGLLSGSLDDFSAIDVARDCMDPVAKIEDDLFNMITFVSDTYIRSRMYGDYILLT